MKIKENVYAVGVQNPSLRVFDIIMKTEYGTTYNAYLVKGNEKNALIELVHADFWDEYIENITALTDIKSIDYVILNHTEPDHSGSIIKLLELNPNITIITSMAGQKYLRAIANRDFNSQIVRDGDTLDLGGKTLRFFSAPFLHWPDSMFTYIQEDSILFSCDFLGAHFCEPRGVDTKIAYDKRYNKSFLYYYNAIFGPFKEYVLKGLDKISDLNLDVVCPSHGPILTTSINAAIFKYRGWSEAALQKNDIKKVFILYASAYGCTATLAKAIADGISIHGNFDIENVNVLDITLDEIKEKIDVSDVIIFGSPTLNRDAVKPIWDALSVVDAITNRDKIAGAFGSYGWSGEAVKMLIDRMIGLKLKVIGNGVRANFAPSQDEIKTAFEYGEEIAKNIITA